MNRRSFLRVAGLSAAAMAVTRLPAEALPKRPNIVYILADDLGYGDVRALNKDCKIPTPNIDRLAREGMIFTDAHSGSAVCTPTRYGVLTGRYCWRTRVKSGVLGGYSRPLIPTDRMTVASLLKTHGYNTAGFGKWHLGLEWAFRRDNVNPEDWDQEPDAIDFTMPIGHGPTSLGFDYFFGIPASLDMAPYVYVENDTVTAVPEGEIDASAGKAFWRKGPIAPDFKHGEVMATLTEKAVKYIEGQSPDNPFFMYFPLTAPHKPIVPSKAFRGKSGTNEWGDFVMEVDWTVGQIMDVLRRNGLEDNTLLILTSDNGATPGADFAELATFGHDPSYIFRGKKADIFEGGHRIPFIARWPERVKAGSTCNETICLTDLMATAADIVSVTLPDDAGEDSVSILPALTAKRFSGPLREATVHHSINGSFSIRQGKWKLELCPGSGGWSTPRPGTKKAKKLPPVQLYDLSADIAETTNLQGKHPKVVKRMTALLQRYVDRGRSTPGKPQENEGKTSIFRQ